MAELTEREQVLLMKAIDGDLSAGERREFEELLRTNAAFLAEWQSSKQVKEITMTMKLKEPTEETWDRYWAGVYARIERGLAWLLISIGGAIVLGFGLYQAALEFLQDASLSPVMKIAIGGLVLGLAILLMSVIREKWFTSKTDKYKGVIR